MAREPRTSDQLKKARKLVAEALDSLDKAISKMEESKIPSVLLHGGTQVTRDLPALWRWAKKVELDTEEQVHFFDLGEDSRAKVDADRHKARVKKAKSDKR